MTRHEAVEYWSWRIGLGVVFFGVFTFGLFDAVKNREARECREGQAEIESFERCESHPDCNPTREDMHILIAAEKIVALRCEVDDAEI